MTPILRIVRVGAAVALLVGLSGWVLGRARFGASDEAALAKVQTELQQRIDAGAATLGGLSERITREEAAIRRMPRDQAAIRRLFDIVGDAIGDGESGRTGITIYDSDSTPLAWGGRVLDLPRERLDGPAALLVASGAFGPSLIRVEPVPAFPAPRIATVVVEQALGQLQSAPELSDTFLLPTSLVAVRVRAHVGDVPASDRPLTFVIRAPGGGALLDAEVPTGDLAAARAGWRSGTWAAVMIVLAVMLLLCAGPLVDQRRRTGKSTVFLLTTATLVVLVTGARSLLFFALRPFSSAGPTPLDLLLTTLTMAAVVWLVMDLVEHRRFARPRPPVSSRTTGGHAGGRSRIPGRRRRECGAVLGLRRSAAPRRRGHRSQPAAFFAAPDQRRAVRGRICAGAAARVRRLGSGGHHSAPGDVVAHAADAVLAAARIGRMAHRIAASRR